MARAQSWPALWPLMEMLHQKLAVYGNYTTFFMHISSICDALVAITTAFPTEHKILDLVRIEDAARILLARGHS